MGPRPRRGLPTRFFVYAVAVALTAAGLVSYGIISFHLTSSGLVPLAMVPVSFATAMASGAVAALANDWLYDRIGPSVLLALPLLVAVVSPLALGEHLRWVLTGMLCWGFAADLQDSTIKALVVDLVPASRRATAYGVPQQGGRQHRGGLQHDPTGSATDGCIQPCRVG